MMRRCRMRPGMKRGTSIDFVQSLAMVATAEQHRICAKGLANKGNFWKRKHFSWLNFRRCSTYQQRMDEHTR